ncbi:Ion channel CASTOR [Porphyridium purpureum]|uniref:Ion channel CASTOR n=1 Tax=Porphyridium purpureum TaxID=35688 RepID=A0A5J4YLL2_PORPP|nr:Ion channel CASTOR [Porphyridium purpureum]|eukprot:POR4672..scf249_10
MAWVVYHPLLVNEIQSRHCACVSRTATSIIANTFRCGTMRSPNGTGRAAVSGKALAVSLSMGLAANASPSVWTQGATSSNRTLGRFRHAFSPTASALQWIWDRLTKLDYVVENALARDANSSLLILVLIIALLLVSGMVSYFFALSRNSAYQKEQASKTGEAPTDSRRVTLVKSFWDSWSVLSNTSYYEETRGLYANMVLTFLAVSHYCVFALLFGSVGQAINQRIELVGAGLTRVLEEKHLVIIGYNSSVDEIVRQVALGFVRSNQHEIPVVLLTSKSRIELETRLRDALGDDFKLVRLLCRQGDPEDRDVLQRINVTQARTILMLPPTDQLTHPREWNRKALKIACLVRECGGKAPIVIQSPSASSQKYSDVATVLGSASVDMGRVKYVSGVEVIGRVAVEFWAEPQGFDQLLYELLSFDGCEFYHRAIDSHFSGLVGLNFKEAARTFQNGVLCGIIRDKQILLSPHATETVIGQNDSLLILAEDSPSIVLEKAKAPGVSEVWEPLERRIGAHLHKVVRQRQRQYLIIGWRLGLADALSQLDRCSAKGSTVTFLATEDTQLRQKELNAALKERGLKLNNLKVRMERIEHIQANLVAEQLGTRWFDSSVFVFETGLTEGNENSKIGLNIPEFDSNSLYRIASVGKEVQKRSGQVFSEIFEEDVARSVRFLYPEFHVIPLLDVVSWILAQNAVSGDIGHVWEKLLDMRTGDRILMQRVEPEFKAQLAGESVSFRQLSELFLLDRAILLGYSKANGEFLLNPPDKDAATVSLDELENFVLLLGDHAEPTRARPSR